MQSLTDATRSLRTGGLRAVINTLGAEAVLVWAAVAMRRRVAVVAPSPSDAARAVQILPALVSHRWAIAAGSEAGGTFNFVEDAFPVLVPLVTLSDGSVAGLSQPPSVVDATTVQLVETGLRTQLAYLGYSAAADGGEEQQGSKAGAGSGWIAGFTDPSVTGLTDLWDVCVDFNTRAVSIAEHAKSVYYRVAVCA
jgi:hypothetical protein